MYARIALAIVGDIKRGALRPADRLPSTREVARRFSVNRNTIVAAYDELVAQGWVVSRGQAGSYVADALPDPKPQRGATAGMATRPGYSFRAIAPSRSVLDRDEARYHLSAGVPDTRILPTAALARAYRRVLRSRGARAALDYGDSRGMVRLRTAIAAMVREDRAIPAGAENILVTNGSQNALDLVARLIVKPGAIAAVERLGYRPAWRAFEEAGAKLAPIALDGEGLIVDSIPARTSCVYATPHHQYPTTVLLSAVRRLALLERARADGFAIIEDDYDHEFHFVGRPVAPLAAMDQGRNVIYVGTLSKILAPGLRLGFIVASERVIAELARLRTVADRHGNHVTELAVADLIEDGELQRHARKMRRIYGARRDALLAALDRELGGAVECNPPPGGLSLWVRVADDIALDAWCRRAAARGVHVTPARELDLEAKSHPFIRLTYGAYDESELVDAVRRLRAALA